MFITTLETVICIIIQKRLHYNIGCARFLRKLKHFDVGCTMASFLRLDIPDSSYTLHGNVVLSFLREACFILQTPSQNRTIFSSTLRAPSCCLFEWFCADSRSFSCSTEISFRSRSTHFSFQ